VNEGSIRLVENEDSNIELSVNEVPISEYFIEEVSIFTALDIENVNESEINDVFI